LSKWPFFSLRVGEWVTYELVPVLNKILGVPQILQWKIFWLQYCSRECSRFFSSTQTRLHNIHVHQPCTWIFAWWRHLHYATTTHYL